MVNKKEVVVGKVYVYDIEGIMDSKTLLVKALAVPNIGTKWLVRVMNVETGEIFDTKENYLTNISILINMTYEYYKNEPSGRYKETESRRMDKAMNAYCKYIRANGKESKELLELGTESRRRFDSLYAEFIDAESEIAVSIANTRKDCLGIEIDDGTTDGRFKIDDICVFDISNESGFDASLVKVKGVLTDNEDSANPAVPTITYIVQSMNDESYMLAVSDNYLMSIPKFIEVYDCINGLSNAKMSNTMETVKAAIISYEPEIFTPKKPKRHFSEDDMFNVGDYCLYDIFNTSNKMSLVRIETFTASADSFSKKQLVNAANSVLMYNVELETMFEGDPALLTSVSTARYVYSYAPSVPYLLEESEKIAELFKIVDTMIKEDSPEIGDNANEKFKSSLDLFKQSYAQRNSMIRGKMLPKINDNASRNTLFCPVVNTADTENKPGKDSSVSKQHNCKECIRQSCNSRTEPYNSVIKKEFISPELQEIGPICSIISLLLNDLFNDTDK